MTLFNKQISIIGCGWLGLPLAKYLSNEGFVIKGSTTSSKKLELLKTHHIEGFLIHLNETDVIGMLILFLAAFALKNYPNLN